MKKEWIAPEMACLYVGETKGGGPYVKQDAFWSDEDPTPVNLNIS